MHKQNKYYYGPGGVPENLGINFFYHLIGPLFVITLGVDAVWALWATAIPRLIDAFTDPIMGIISDNWKGKFGKRRPFIFLGTLLSALCVIGLVWTPATASTTFHTVWLISFLILATIGSTIFVIPYTALGFELAENEHQRTSWMAWRSVFNKLSGIGVQWLFWLIQLPAFGGALLGARNVGLIVALIILIAGMIPALLLKENPVRVKKAERVPFKESWKLILKDRKFKVLALCSFLTYASILLVDGIGFYLHVFYVFEGNRELSGWYKGLGGTLFHLSGLLATPLIVYISKRFGKTRALKLCLLSIAMGGVAKIIFWVPNPGWFVIIPSLFLGPGLVAVYILLYSLLADIAAEDEKQTGICRQGLYIACFQFISKLSLSTVFFSSGLLIWILGFEQDLGVNQSPMVFEYMRWIFSMTTVILVLIAYRVLNFYISTKRVENKTKRTKLETI